MLWLCICLCALATGYSPTPLELASWNLSQEVYMWWSEKAFFLSFFKNFNCYELCPFLRFSQFHANITFKITNHDDWYIKLKPWTSRKRCMWLNCIRWAQSIMLRRQKMRKVWRRNNLDTEGRCPQMVYNRNPCSESPVAVGAREGHQ